MSVTENGVPLMIGAADPIIIRSEEDAWNVLRALADSSIDESFAAGGLRLIGWPKEVVYLPKEAHSSISSPMMEAFLEMQGCIYRSYLAASNRPQKLNWLTGTEKTSLTIKIIVTGGSSWFGVDFDDIIKSFCKELVGKMSTREIVGIAALLIILFFGTEAYKAWLAHSKDIEEIRVSSEKEIKISSISSEERKKTSEIEAERQRILLQFVNKSEAHRAIRDQSEASHEAMLKGVAKSGGGKYLGVYVTTEEVEEILGKPKEGGVPFKIESRYKVEKIEDNENGQFKAWLSNKPEGGDIQADFSSMTLPSEQRKLLFQSLDGGPPVSVVINGWQRGGKVVRAEILRVEECRQ